MSKITKEEVEFITRCLKQGKPLSDTYIFNFLGPDPQSFDDRGEQRVTGNRKSSFSFDFEQCIWYIKSE